MRKVALILALVFAADAAIDSFDADCAAATAEQPCHACLCRTAAIAPAVVVSVNAPQTPRLIVALLLPDSRLIDKSFLQPPKLLA